MWLGNRRSHSGLVRSVRSQGFSNSLRAIALFAKATSSSLNTNYFEWSNLSEGYCTEFYPRCNHLIPVRSSLAVLVSDAFNTALAWACLYNLIPTPRKLCLVLGNKWALETSDLDMQTLEVSDWNGWMLEISDRGLP